MAEEITLELIYEKLGEMDKKLDEHDHYFATLALHILDIKRDIQEIKDSEKVL